jgi:hypothetical protein
MLYEYAVAMRVDIRENNVVTNEAQIFFEAAVRLGYEIEAGWGCESR